MYLKTKLSLTSFEIFPIGSINITLKRTNETFTILQPTVNVHNYIVGNPYLWYKGEMTCVNKKTGDRAVINFRQKGWTSNGDYECDGSISDNQGIKVFELYGMWNNFLIAVNPYTREETMLAKMKPEVYLSNKQFYFSKFVIGLNYLNQQMLKKIAPTDSRLRTDLRAYEYGNIDLASKEKERLENKQRERRKQAQAKEY